MLQKVYFVSISLSFLFYRKFVIITIEQHFHHFFLTFHRAQFYGIIFVIGKKIGFKNLQKVEGENEKITRGVGVRLFGFPHDKVQ